jgi:hypothetical protein
MIDIGISFALIILGIYWIWLTSKEPVNPFFSVTFKGYAFGALCVICAIFYFLHTF